MPRLGKVKAEGTGGPLIVAHLVYSFNIGGLERVIANLINSSDQNKVCHVIITLVPEHDFASRLKKETQVYCLNKRPGNDFSSHFRLYRLLRKIKPNVLHSYNFGTIEYHATAFFAGVSRRVHAEHGRDGEYDTKARKRRTLVRKLLLPFIDYFIVVSPDLYRWAKEELRTKEPKLQLVLNGIDTKSFACERDRLCGERVTFITVGRLAQIKNQALLIDAFEIFLNSQSVNTSARLVIVGEGPLFKELNKKIKSKSLSDSVFLLGARSDVHELLRQADVFVLSSNYEAMPMTVLEAMASGLPVICTDVGGVRNIVQDQKTGLLVTAGDAESMAAAMHKLLKDKQQLNSIIQNSKIVVNEKYSVNAMKNHYERLYGL